MMEVITQQVFLPKIKNNDCYLLQWFSSQHVKYITNTLQCQKSGRSKIGVFIH